MLTLDELKTELKFLNPMTVIKSGLERLSSQSDLVNRLSMESNTEPKEIGINYLNPECILKDMKNTAEALKMYHRAKEDITSACDDPQMSIDLVKKLVEAFTDKTKCDNPDKVTALTMFNMDLLNECSTTLYTLTSLYDCPMVFLRQVERLFMRFTYALNSGLRAFGVEEISVAKDDSFTIPVVYTLNDRVVTYTQDELEEIERKKREKEEADRIAAKNKEAADRVAEQAKLIMTCYNRLKSSNNLSKINLSQEALEALNGLKDIAACDKVVSLYKLLMAMSASVRYMPGEKAPDEDRIMGSFMELEKDVATYSAPFTVYLGEFGLNHNDVVRAIPMFDLVDSAEHILAQYVDTKQFIDQFVKELNPVPKAIHIFKM